MKLILQNINGSYHAYIEKEKHFQKVDKGRSGKVEDPKKVLDHECYLGFSLLPGQYMVFDLK